MSPWERMSTINGHNIHIYIVLVNFVRGTYCIYIYWFIYVFIHPASRGVAAHTAGLFRSVRGAKGGVEYEEQSSTGELTYITAGFVNIFLSGLKICFLPHELDMSAASNAKE